MRSRATAALPPAHRRRGAGGALGCSFCRDLDPIPTKSLPPALFNHGSNEGQDPNSQKAIGEKIAREPAKRLSISHSVNRQPGPNSIVSRVQRIYSPEFGEERAGVAAPLPASIRGGVKHQH